MRASSAYTWLGPVTYSTPSAARGVVSSPNACMGKIHFSLSDETFEVFICFRGLKRLPESFPL